MNILSLIALFLAIAVFLVSIVTSTDNPMKMLDVHGILIVVGGSVAATAISFQIDRCFLMLKVFFLRTLKDHKPNYVKTIKELMNLADAYRNDSPDLRAMVLNSRDPFIREAMNFLLDELVEQKQMLKILRSRVDTMYDRYAADAYRFKATGKYPPAMGLMGAGEPKNSAPSI